MTEREALARALAAALQEQLPGYAATIPAPCVLYLQRGRERRVAMMVYLDKSDVLVGKYGQSGPLWSCPYCDPRFLERVLAEAARLAE